MNNRDFNDKFRDVAEREDGSKHTLKSKAYKKFFDCYEEQRVLDEKDHVHIKRVYCGDWYVPELDKRQYILQRVSLGVMYLLSFALFILCATRNLTVNKTWYMAVAQGAATIILIAYAISMISLLTAKKQLTIYEYKSGSVMVRKFSLICAVPFVILTAISVGYALYNEDNIGGHLLAGGGYALCCLLSLIQNRLEANVTYKKAPSAGQE